MSIFLKIKMALTFAVILLSANCNDAFVFDKAQQCADAVVTHGTCRTDASESKDEADGQPQASPEETPPAPSPPAVAIESRVYLDATESMRGFAAPKENNQFVKLLGNIGYAMPNCRLFKYGISQAQKTPSNEIADVLQEIPFSKAFESESFYNLLHNPDELLIRTLANEEKPVRSVLITDGVYSSPRAELQSETVRAVEDWMKRGRFFGILVFKSPFKGRFWSENKRIWLENANVESRPFYAFVFSPDETGFVELRDKLKAEFADVDQLSFPKEAARCEIKPQTREFLDTHTEPPASKYYLHYYTSEIFNANKTAELFYDLDCRPAENYPVEKFVEQVGLEYYSWTDDGFKENKTPPVFRIERPANENETENPEASPSVEPATNSGNLKISINSEPRDQYSLYQLTVSLSNNNNLLSKIRRLSTQDDSIYQDMDKTYRFYEFIAAVTSVHLQSGQAVKLPPPAFVVLTN